MLLPGGGRCGLAGIGLWRILSRWVPPGSRRFFDRSTNNFSKGRQVWGDFFFVWAGSSSRAGKCINFLWTPDGSGSRGLPKGDYLTPGGGSEWFLLTKPISYE